MAEKLPDLMKAFESDVGSGFEEVTSSDIQIPFLRLIQALSPQLKKSDPAFIEGASSGDIFNTVTKKTWDGEKGVVVIPVFFQLKLLEFIPRSQGGGFVSELSPTSDDVRKAVRDQDSGLELLESGNELVRTAQHYVKIAHDDGNFENAIIDMKKTQLKKSRQWMSIMTMQKHNGKTLPMFANTYRLKSVEDGNDKGSWNSWSISHEGQVSTMEAYEDAKALHSSVSSGELKPALPTDTDDVPF
jgi:hypothetical protein|tara:strand:+ start:1726 stop:2457 length:732 start_codon:yes stop_codon:yes gene_type:complete